MDKALDFFYGKYPDEPNQKKVRVLKRDKSIPVVSGTANKILVEFFISNNCMHCGIFTIAPNSRGEETPSHKGDEFYYVLSGNGVLHVVEEEKSYRINEKEVGYLPAGFRHYWLNFSNVPLEVLFVIAEDI